MNVKRYFAKTAREALRALKEDLGADAIVLSNRAVDGGVEILALPADAVGAGVQPAPAEAVKVASAPVEHPVRAMAPEGGRDDEASDYRVSLSRPSELFAYNVGTAEVTSPKGPARVPKRADSDGGLDQTKPRIARPLVAAPMARAEPPLRPAAESVVRKEMPSTSVEELARIKALEAANGQLMHELGAIRGLLERQLAGFAWGEQARQAPARASLLGELLESGFSATLARQLTEAVGETADLIAARNQVKLALDGRLQLLDSDADIIDRGGVFALVGPTGVGKTTTTAKLAARCVVRHGASKLALITTDGYRIGAHEQLRIYGRILGVPVFVVRDASDLRQTLGELRGKHMVLIDTVGVSQRDRMVAEQTAMLLGAGQVQRLLLLNATSRGDTLDDVIRAYNGPSMAGCVLTKVDEAASLAPAVDAVVRHGLNLFYVANGQRVPEDLHTPNRAYLLHRALKEIPKTSDFRLTRDEAGILLAAAPEGVFGA
ncbi:MAG: flagellar biosynthesis protein FlhF [Zoogloeaceae bacterium]|nr:flagellar biosynthesis protein FlhF [Zoogloeaceae bacterium]